MYIHKITDTTPTKDAVLPETSSALSRDLIPVQEPPLPSHTQSDTGIQSLSTFSKVHIYGHSINNAWLEFLSILYASFQCIATHSLPADIPASPAKLSPSGEYCLA